MPEFAITFLGQHCSGHNDSSNLKHAVVHKDDAVRGGIVGIDVALNDDKGGKDYLERMKKEDAKMTVEKFKAEYKIAGDNAVVEDVRKDLIVRVLNADKFYKGKDVEHTREELVKELVDLITDEEDPLCPLYVDNGESCSTGGGSIRARSLLSKIPFLKKFYKLIDDNFDIKQTWCRASSKGTHKWHDDSFSRGATYRVILSINCFGKEMHFGY